MNLDFGFGMVGDGDDIDGTMGARVRLGGEKRFHFGHGVYAAAGADFAFESRGYENVNELNSVTNAADGEITVSTFNLAPRAEVGYYFNPNLKVYAGAGYTLPLSTNATDDDDNEFDFDMNGGLSFTAGFAAHVGFAGPFASMMANPSTECQELRNAQLEALAAEEAGDAEENGEE